jgi:hypothetical protein
VTAATAHIHGRTADEWGKLVDHGLRFLIEQARMGRTTTYTEMNAVLERRTGVRPFDFSQDGERAAIGELLGRIVERDVPESGQMISAIVIYVDENDAGPGFYKLAQESGMLPTPASKDQKLAFWSKQVAEVHKRHRTRRPG